MKVLVTGGAGFIGSNLASRLLRGGNSEVIVYDNLSRRGTEKNLKWLYDEFGDEFVLVKDDIRNYDRLKEAINGVDVVYHIAGQVAVTTSVMNPREDFEINALGTLNVLEAARLSERPPIVLFTSTNKVYGGMENVEIVRKGERYTYRDFPYGISEDFPLDFHSPYGCSKGAADQYVRDYGRIYGLRTVVFRQSCIYGSRQFGNEDQGWVAHFLISAATRRPITIYGDGRQVRDVLHVDDLISAFAMALKNIEVTSGKVYNIGGGPDKAVSVWSEFKEYLKELTGWEVECAYDDWRPGDQKVYISDIRRAKEDFGWEPKISVRGGFEKLFRWIVENKNIFEQGQR
jgi:CDP-paratose 2-epimerase